MLGRREPAERVRPVDHDTGGSKPLAPLSAHRGAPGSKNAGPTHGIPGA